MTAPKTRVNDLGVVIVNDKCVGLVTTREARDALRVALAELEALRPAPPEDVPITQLKGRIIDGETKPVDWCATNGNGTGWWVDAGGTYHPLTVDPATATVKCRPLDPDA